MPTDPKILAMQKEIISLARKNIENKTEFTTSVFRIYDPQNPGFAKLVYRIHEPQILQWLIQNNGNINQMIWQFYQKELEINSGKIRRYSDLKHGSVLPPP